MKTRTLAAILMLSLCVLLTGCTVQNIFPDSGTESRAAPDPSVLEAYRAVLRNETVFFSTDNGKHLLLQDFLGNREIYDVVFKITRFTVLDMDSDRAPEVVLELTVNDNPSFFEVMHYYNGTVYGYLFSYRGMQELKEDGVFLFSGGAADTGVGKLKFEAQDLKTVILGYSESRQNETDLEIVYYIEDDRVNEKAFNDFLDEQLGKKNAKWYEFSNENIELLLSEG